MATQSSAETGNNSDSRSSKWRKILATEMFEYFFNFAFLLVFLWAFTWYRRLILAEYHIQYSGYWAPLLQAAILAKIVMIGDALHLGRKFQNKPRAITALYRTVVYSILVVLFSFAEHIIGAKIHGKTAADGIAEIANKGIDEILAWCVVFFAAFLPFFLLKEVERAFGVEKVRGMLFRRHE